MPPIDDAILDEELSGLDELDMPVASPARRWSERAWAATWPKLAAMAVVLAIWQLVVWSGWKPEYVLPGPAAVLPRVLRGFTQDDFLNSIRITMSRGVFGFAIALVIGTVIGTAVARVPVLRAALGSLITGLQTMPSITWFPLAIVLFQISEAAILFVVVLGAAPAIANGLISGIDHVPPLLLRAGRTMGARGLATYRHVVLPAALPGYLAGLKQGWAFAWRSLLAGELLVVIGSHPSLGVRLDAARQLSDYELLLALMIVVLAVGVLVDSLVFGVAERAVRRRFGLLDTGTT